MLMNMDVAVVCLVAAVAAGLTLFSGFGLGTLLMPAFALFFPVTEAVAATAVVHLANNLFKLGLVGRDADRRTVLVFGLPAAGASVLGAACLTLVARAPVLAEYDAGGITARMTVVGTVVGIVMIAFAALELSPRFDRLAFGREHLAVGGVVSGFFGGLSGHQGALRSAFLVRLNLDKRAFLGTGVVSAVLVDAARLSVYGAAWAGDARRFGAWGLLAAACGAACVGSFLGSRLFAKVTMRSVRWVIGVMLLVIGAGLASGLINAGA